MVDFAKITWGSGCTYDDIYYDDGYMDFLFIYADIADVIEPIYEVVKNDTKKRDGRDISPDKYAKKTHKIAFLASEAVCDTLNTIPLAEMVIIQLPDGTIATMRGDDVEVNINEPEYDSYSKSNYFKAELLFLTDVTIKGQCCSTWEAIPEDATPPTITADSVTGDEISLTGTAPDNYMVRGYAREFYQSQLCNDTIYKLCMLSQFEGWFVSIGNKVYRTTDGFVSGTLKYTAGFTVNAIQTIDGINIIIVGNSGNYAISQDSGATWTPYLVGVDDFYNVRIADSQQLVMCGKNGKVYCSDDFGVTLMLQTTGTTVKFFGLDYWDNAGTDEWVLVGENGRILQMSVTNYTIDNAPTLSIVGGNNRYDFTYYAANKGYTVGAGGVISVTPDYGNTWNGLTSGLYTSFSACCVCKYGVLCVGVEDVLIEPDETLTLILDGETTARTDVGSIPNGLPTACIGTTTALVSDKVVSAFAEVGSSTASQFSNGDLVLTMPLTGRTYVVKVEAFIPQYTGGQSDEEVILVT